MIFKNEKQLIANGRTENLRKARKNVLTLLDKGIDAVNPYQLMVSYFKGNQLNYGSEQIILDDFSKIFIVSFGKASIGMTQAVLDHCNVFEGVVITNDKEKKILNPNIKTFHGGHPYPNQGSINGTKAIEKLICNVTTNDLLLILISGGGSALLCHPRIPLQDMQKTTSYLLKCGANIQEINTVRKHLSYVKGGQLIQNLKGKAFSFIISDVIGDPLNSISSGPTIGDETSFNDVKKIFVKYDLWNITPPSVQLLIRKGLDNRIPETPTIDDLKNIDIKNKIIANNHLACQRIFHEAVALGYKPFIHSNSLNGEASIIGNELLDIFVEKYLKDNITLLISGGETTVTVKGMGSGGRNQEMVLATIEKLNHYSIIFASCGTDGIDGMSTAAGAIGDPKSLQRSQEIHLDTKNFLKNNDSNGFFQKLHDVLITGPTGTNVMDIQIMIKIES